MSRKREVLDALATHVKMLEDGPQICDLCPFQSEGRNCLNAVLNTAIDVINEGSYPYVPEVGIGDDGDVFYCGNCDNRVRRRYKFCPECGYPIDWSDLSAEGYNEEMEENEEIEEYGVYDTYDEGDDDDEIDGMVPVRY